jgi:hypothetical protein
MVIETDQGIPGDAIQEIAAIPHVLAANYVQPV